MASEIALRTTVLRNFKAAFFSDEKARSGSMQGAIPKQESRIPYVTYDVDNLNDREVEENIFDDETVWLDADDLSPPFHYSSDMEQEDSVKPPYR